MEVSIRVLIWDMITVFAGGHEETKQKMPRKRAGLPFEV
jgi:hypothetical protein